MDFLYRLYSNNFFGVGLFIVITVLAFMFLIILFFGKKDEKARLAKEKRIEEANQKEEIKEEVVSEVPIDTLEPITLNEEVISNIETIPEEQIEVEEPISEASEELEVFDETPASEFDPFVTNNIVLNTDYITEESPEEVQENDTEASDIYNLDSIMNEEQEPITVMEDTEESIDDVLNKYNAIEETLLKEQPNSKEENIPVVEENDLNIFDNSNEVTKKASTPFSSVYLTKEEAETKAEETVSQSTPITPSSLSHSSFEMPKRMDLPKKSESAINESIISSINTEDSSSPFNQLEEDSYNIGE